MNVLFIVGSLSIAGEPMGLMQLSAIAKQKGNKTHLCLASHDYIKAIRLFRPQLIAITLMSTEYNLMKNAIRVIRKYFPQIPIVLGGPHPTFVPNIIEEVNADAICVGEGDLAFKEILKRVESRSGFEGIVNIQTKDRKMPLGPLVDNLDSLPFIDREIIYENSLALKKFRLRSFYTSRGCLFQCTYCFNHAYNKLTSGLGRVVRKRTVDNLLEEIEMVIKRYPTDYIKFSDDSFVYKADSWLDEFAEKYRKRIKMPFYCLVRPSCVTSDIVKLLKYAGCSSVCMSIETANSNIRKNIVKRNVETEQITKAFDLFNRAGISIYSNSMFGLPLTTINDEIETLNLNIRCRPALGHFTICVPFPGTEIFDFCVQRGLLKKEFTFTNMNKSTCDYSILDSFSKQEKRIQKNLLLLGPLVVRIPLLKKIVTRRLVRWPNNIIFFLIYYLTVQFLFKKYIIPIKYSIADYIVLGWDTLKFRLQQVFTGRD